MTPRIGNTPKQIINPRHNQPIRAGEWKAPTKGTSNNIFIQNNYYGSNYRNWGGNAWAQYDRSDNNSGGSKFGEILGYVGLGLGGLASIIGLFKKDKSATQKQPQPEAQPQPQAQPQAQPQVQQGKSQVKPQTQAQTQPEVQPQSQTQPKPAVTQQEKQKVQPETTTPTQPTIQPDNLGGDADKIDAGDDVNLPDGTNIDWNNSSTVVQDNQGKTATRDISGQIKDAVGENGKFPKSFTVADSSGNFKFKLVGTDKNSGKPVYQCTEGPNGAKYTKGNNYVMDVSGGKPKLSQPADYTGSGFSLSKSQTM